MRAVRYNVAATLDGYIAGPNGEFDWIPNDDAVDFAGIFARVDTVLIGRKTYEVVQRMGPPPWTPKTRVYVFSTTLEPTSCSGATLVSTDSTGVVNALRHEPGNGEIWLFGGGDLFRRLLAAGQVDSVEITIVPVLLGAGIPLLPPGGSRTELTLRNTRQYPSGMVTLTYSVKSVV